MPFEVNTVFKNFPKLYKMEVLNASKIISELTNNINEFYKKENQLFIKIQLGINNDFDIEFISKNKSLLKFKNNNKIYIISILNNTFIIN
jgi:hypothetical protein